MPYIWFNDEKNQWQSQALSISEKSRLTAMAIAETGKRDTATSGPFAFLSAAQTEAGNCWVIISRPDDDIRINATRNHLGIRAIEDRDEITIFAAGGTVGRYFFSTEELAKVEPYPRADSAICPRCRNAISRSQPAIRCPTCSVWSHHGDPPCWEYCETCGACHAQSTNLDAGFRWTPESL